MKGEIRVTSLSDRVSVTTTGEEVEDFIDCCRVRDLQKEQSNKPSSFAVIQLPK